MDNDAATTKPRYSAEVSDGFSRSTIGKVQAESITGIVEGAWQLNRYTESPIDIYDERDEETGARRKLGTLHLDWLDD